MGKRSNGLREHIPSGKTSKGIQAYDVDVEKEHLQNEAKWKLAMLLIWQASQKR